ncbi:MarR family transcriptional regulator [Actinomycetes bacterium KLBMP 9797]
MPVPEDVALADSLEALFQRIGCAQTDSDLHALLTADLSISQFKCLITLAREEHPIPIHDLAERLRLSLATAGRTIDRLVAQELVIRREDPDDRRVRRVSVSAKGRHLITGIDEAHRTALVAFVRSLAAADQARLQAALLPIIRPTPLLEEQLA